MSYAEETGMNFLNEMAQIMTANDVEDQLSVVSFIRNIAKGDFIDVSLLFISLT